jgi:symplekin
LQVMVDLSPIPPLFMRTVIQSLYNCEDLAPAISGVLIRLIKKKVWETKVLWDGFVKCIKIPALKQFVAEVCLQLPQKQLKQLLTEHAELRDPVKEYIINTKQKVVHEEILEVLELVRNDNGDFVSK